MNIMDIPLIFFLIACDGFYRLLDLLQSLWESRVFKLCIHRLDIIFRSDSNFFGS